MEFVILGLLALRSMSIYEIKKSLERGVTLFYSASFGSINAALDRMLAKGWVTGEERVEHGRNKKIFHLTPAGQQAFRAWLVSDIEEEKVKDPALTRLFFLGLAPAGERIRVLEAHIQKLRGILSQLDFLHQQNTSLQIPPEQQEIAKFQLFTLQYGRDFYAFSIRWYETLLESLRQTNHKTGR